ncbi:unnamed protein product [Cyprideis torosa]|uniref:Uncharacterized protein n=1 Tax=Cyprideis torosa TaxID=163714 RepID=A0A7R8ZLS4_9CRUS|nr:unnamed protein product [Cyprideis torosa]CAG0882833.1 unnamed protein product [Cyprideis torosa]
MRVRKKPLTSSVVLAILVTSLILPHHGVHCRKGYRKHPKPNSRTNYSSPVCRQNPTSQLCVFSKVRIEQIKNQILDLLGMDKPPDMSSFPFRNLTENFRIQELQKEMEEDFRIQADAPLVNNEEAKNQMFFSFHSAPPSHVVDRLRDYDVIYFPFQGQLLKEEIKAADLWFKLRKNHHRYDRGSLDISKSPYPSKLTIYKIHFKTTKESPILEAVMTATIPSKLIMSSGHEEELVSLNMTAVVRQWIRNPDENYGLVIQSDSDLYSLVKEVDSPFLEIHPHDGRARYRRTLQPHDECRAGVLNPDHCCLYQLTVHVKALGWDDWIIAPKDFQANYCAGSCPKYYRSLNPEWTHIVESSGQSLHACCAPSKLSHLHIIHYDFDSAGRPLIAYTTIPRMTAMACGCA